VVGLGALRAGHVRVVSELAPRFGKGPDLVVELAERRSDLGVDHRLDGSQGGAIPLVEPHEGHALFQLQKRAHPSPESLIRIGSPRWCAQSVNQA
jgi:hypothetical protein